MYNFFFVLYIQIRNDVAELTKHPIYDVRLIRDKITDMSRGFAFVEFGVPEVRIY